MAQERIGMLVQADPIENGFIVKLKYGRVVRNCYCKDENAVAECVSKCLTEEWPAELEDLIPDEG